MIAIEIKPFIGIGELAFGAGIADAEGIFGKPEDIQLLDEMEISKSTVFHYWQRGFSLFFDEFNLREFCCAEVDVSSNAQLWGVSIFKLSEKQIIDLLKEKGLKNIETEQHDWGEKRVSCESINIDFYFERNKLISINFGRSVENNHMILSN